MSITIDRNDLVSDSRSEMYARDIPRGVPFTTTDDDRDQVYVRISDVNYVAINADPAAPTFTVVMLNQLYQLTDVRLVHLRIEVTK